MAGIDNGWRPIEAEYVLHIHRRWQDELFQTQRAVSFAHWYRAVKRHAQYCLCVRCCQLQTKFLVRQGFERRRGPCQRRLGCCWLDNNKKGPDGNQGLRISGAIDGTRTRNTRDHNPVLYQLNYDRHWYCKTLARLARLELTTYGLEGRCSIRLSYRRLTSTRYYVLRLLGNWSGRWDSNSRSPGPKPGAITGLRYAPKRARL